VVCLNILLYFSTLQPLRADESVGSHGSLLGTVPVRGGVDTQPSLGSCDPYLRLILQNLTWVNELELKGFSP
jgi:hypothetical protein